VGALVQREWFDVVDDAPATFGQHGHCHVRPQLAGRSLGRLHHHLQPTCVHLTTVRHQQLVAILNYFYDIIFELALLKKKPEGCKDCD